MPVGNTRRLWEFRARTLAWRINAALWLERAAPASFHVASFGAIALYATRRHDGPVSITWFALLIVGLGTAAVVGWCLRERFFSPVDARVLLESHLRLDARLTAASVGLVQWPALTAMPAVVRWKLRNCAIWLSAAVTLLILATQIPIPRSTSATAHEKPPALAQAEAMLGALAEARLVEPQAIEEFEARARELADRPMAAQYTHSALEAADTLRDQTAAATAALSRNLDSAASALKSAHSTTELAASAGRLAAALEGLRDGALPANADLLANLPHNGSALSQLSAEQRAELARQLSEASRTARGISGAAGAGAPMARPDPDSEQISMGEGDGGVGGGEGTAPLAFRNHRSDAGDGIAESLSPAELARLSLSDRLGTTSGAPENDAAQNVDLTSAGEVGGSAKGGDAVGVDRLTPAERSALKKFFK